jgi:hypothetical protein
MQQLFITRSKVRGMFSAGGSFGEGSSSYRDVSRFAKDMPEENLKHTNEKFSSFSAWSDSSLEIDEEFLDRSAKEQKPVKKATKLVREETFIRRRGATDKKEETPSKEKFTKLFTTFIKRADDL